MTRSERLRTLVLKLREDLATAEVNETYRKLHAEDRAKKRRPAYKLVRNLPSMDIRMDGTKNHARPHIHCNIGKQRHAASVAIDSGELLAGKLTSLQVREVQGWVEKYRVELTQLWDEMQAGRPVDPIICKLRAAKD